jgi:GT2 family glycosyltransferase
MNKKIDLSIVIISSKKDYIFDCLRSLESATQGIEAEVILIDNVSQDKIGESVKKQFPKVKVLRREVNGGFGENNNMGMKIAQGRYVLLLNDDTKIIDKNIFFLKRKEAMDEAGLFDEDFFLYVEEVELAYRFARKGWEAWYLPRWKTVHYGMSTNGSEKATIFELQNLVLMYKKHEPKWKIPVLRIILRFGVGLRIILWTVRCKPDITKIYEKAFTAI